METPRLTALLLLGCLLLVWVEGVSPGGGDAVPYADMLEIPAVDAESALQNVGMMLRTLLMEAREEATQKGDAAEEKRAELLIEVEAATSAGERVDARISSISTQLSATPAIQTRLQSDIELLHESLVAQQAYITNHTTKISSIIDTKLGRISGLKKIDLTLAQHHASIVKDGGNSDVKAMVTKLREGVFDTMVEVQEEIVEYEESLSQAKYDTRVKTDTDRRTLMEKVAVSRATSKESELLQGFLHTDQSLSQSASTIGSLLGREIEAAAHSWEFEKSSVDRKIAYLHRAVMSLPSPVMVDDLAAAATPARSTSPFVPTTARAELPTDE